MAGKAADTGAATSEAGKDAAAATAAADAAAAATAAAGKTAAESKAPDGTTKAAEAKAGAAETGKEAQSGKTDDSTKTAADGAAAQKNAPDSYELTVPDDAKRFVSDDDLTRFEEIARANDWTQEEAAAALKEELENHTARAAKTIEAWEGETKKDKTYGGKNLPATQQLGNAVIDKVYPKGHPMRERFVGFLKESGGGVRLEVVAFLADLGRMMGEDTPRSSTSASSSNGDKASKFYDHPTSKKVEEQAAK
jgi:hypothetical protein